MQTICKRCCAAQKLRKPSDPTAYDRLMKKLKAPDRCVRSGAITELATLEDHREESTALALKIMQDPKEDNYVRSTAATALGRLGEASMLDVLRSRFAGQGTAGELRSGAAYGLGFTHDKRVFPILSVRAEGQIGIAIPKGIGPMRHWRDARYASSSDTERVHQRQERSFTDSQQRCRCDHRESLTAKIDDVEIVAALELGGPEFGPDELSDALWKVAEHGQTKATRAAAQRILGPYSEDALRQKGIFVTEEEVAQEAAEKLSLRRRSQHTGCSSAASIIPRR